jgi:4-amino-4-deoxy-L-arabinose transferase-like glycosyltransferase
MQSFGNSELSFLMSRPVSRQTVAVLTLTFITISKLVVLLILLKTGTVQPILTGIAQSHHLPAVGRILTTGTYNDAETRNSSVVAPGYAVFLALLKRITPDRYLSLTVCLQIVFDYGVALLLLFLGRRETSMEAGWLAGILWLVFPPAVVISLHINSESLFTALLVLSVVMFIRALAAQGRIGLSFIAGLTLGLTTLVRGTTQLLPFFFFAISCVQSIPKRLLKCTLFFIGMCLLVLPWTFRNLYVLGEPIVVQTGFGVVFLQGSRSEYFPVLEAQKYFPVVMRQAAEEGLMAPTDGKVTSRDRWYFNLGLRNYRIRLAEEPLSFFPFLVHKFARLWYGLESATFSRQVVLGTISLMVVPIALLQIWQWRKDHLHLSMTLILLILYFIGIHLVSWPGIRYMIPTYPFLIFAASHQYIRFSNLSLFRMDSNLRQRDPQN